MAKQVLEGVAGNSKDAVGTVVADAAKTGAETGAQEAVITGIDSTKKNISDQINAKQESGESLVSGATKLNEGAKVLAEKLPELTKGVADLKDGTAQLSAGAAKLHQTMIHLMPEQQHSMPEQASFQPEHSHS